MRWVLLSERSGSLKTNHIAKCGLFAALTAICAWLSLPVGDVAFTLQSFSVFLGVFTLGGRWGSAAFLVYLTMGAAGLPVFSGFRGGIGTLLGTTGGYIWGFLLGCLLYRWLEKHRIHPLPAAGAAMGLCYACGTLWYFFAYTAGTAASLWAVLLKCVAPYLLPDALKIWLAYTLSRRLKRVV